MDLLDSNRLEQRPCGRRLTNYAAVFLIALFQLPLISSGQPKASTPATATGSLKVAKWKSGGHKGIATGKSRITDVKRLFGEPVWSGAPEQALIHAAPADEIWHEYNAPAAAVTRMTIVVGKRSGVVEGILLYPAHLSFDQVIRQYGREYLLRDNTTGPCIGETDKTKSLSHAEAYPLFLLYPARGMYVTVQKDETVMEMGFLVKCQ